MLESYQNIPSNIDPIVFSIGSFSIRWYAVCYLVAFLFVTALVFWRVARGEDRGVLPASFGERGRRVLYFDLLWMGLFFGVILGGRLGYVLLYNPSYYLMDPLSIISPFDAVSGKYVGIFGMSYFGALIGIFVFSQIYLKLKKINFWKVADFMVPALSGAYFFGRVGNFINGEVFGRKTDFILGMRFGGETFLRHPSQLYQAFLGGIFVFAILWAVRNRKSFEGQILLTYLMLYSSARFCLEFLREPGYGEYVLNNLLTKGQLFSILMLVVSGWIYFQKRGKDAIIKIK